MDTGIQLQVHCIIPVLLKLWQDGGHRALQLHIFINNLTSIYSENTF